MDKDNKKWKIIKYIIVGAVILFVVFIFVSGFFVHFIGGSSPSTARSLMPEFEKPWQSVRDYLYANENPNKSYGAYSIILLPQKPREFSKEDKLFKRYLEICISFENNLKQNIVLKTVNQVDFKDVLINYWLLEKRIENFIEDNNTIKRCTKTVESYNYTRVESIGRSHKINKEILLHQGPILVAKSLLSRNGKTILFDMSELNEREIDAVFRYWISNIQRDPSFWENGWKFKLKIIKSYLRSYLKKYGDIIEIIE